VNVLMFGVDMQASPTFIRRSIDFTRAAGVEISLWEGETRAASRIDKGVLWLQRVPGIPIGLTGAQIAMLRRADVLHFQWAPNLLGWRALARTFGKPTVFSMRGKAIDIEPYQAGNEAYAARMRAALPHVSAYHAVSQAMLDAGVALGAVRERGRVIYTAVDLTVFTPPDVPPAPDAPIVMVGALLARKGYDIALEAFAHLRDAHHLTPRLLIAGEGEARPTIEAQIAALRLGDQVVLLGRQTPEQVRDLLRGGLVLLHTATNEGIANVAVEAMACGTPVITSDVGGMREAVSDGVEGFVTPPADPRASAAALARLLTDDALRLSMGRAGRARAEWQFTPERLGREFAALYEFARSVRG
jgi:glycosyltransferase involved in cell wall biosynthesis